MSIWTVVEGSPEIQCTNSYVPMQMYVASGAQQCTEMLSCNLPRQVAEGKSAAGGRYSKTHTYCGLLRRMHSDYGQQSHKDKEYSSSVSIYVYA